MKLRRRIEKATGGAAGGSNGGKTNGARTHGAARKSGAKNGEGLCLWSPHALGGALLSAPYDDGPCVTGSGGGGDKEGEVGGKGGGDGSSNAINSFFSESDDGTCRESSNACDDVSPYDVCETTDDSLYGLHTHFESNESVNVKVQKVLSFEHDWVLDGTDSDSDGEDELPTTKMRRRRKFGHTALDHMLGMLEIESVSYTSSGSSCGCLEGDASCPAIKINSEEEVIEFADFTYFDSENGENWDGPDQKQNKKIQASADLFISESNLQSDVLYEYESEGNHDISEEKSQITGSSDDEEREPSGCNERNSSPDYKPPHSIECLVSDIDAELNVAVQKCLSLSPSISLSKSEESSNDENCMDLMEALHQDYESGLYLAPQCIREEYKQPLLMSSLLLESLPMPMPCVSCNDPASTFTRRIQKCHLASKSVGRNTAKPPNEMEPKGVALEEKLADKIHPGYYASVGDDCNNDFFDCIVLEEVLHVPWPFHIIDPNESFFYEQSETDSMESENIDYLNFDRYILNRLSELDFSMGEIMSCILSQVRKKETAINEGAEHVFATEIDIATALIYTRSSQDFIHRAKNGYIKPDEQHDQTVKHNAVFGGLDVVHCADTIDRMSHLLETVDQISSICVQEAQWWEKINARLIAAQEFHELVEDTRKLKELVCGEELLCHTICLQPMRDRMEKLPEALLKRIEESLAELFARILRSGANCFDEFALEYRHFLQSWVSCFQLTQQSELNIIATEWSGRVLKILCFEVSRASACSLFDSHETAHGPGLCATSDIQFELCEMKPNDSESLESLSHRLRMMQLGGGHHTGALASTFFHLSSRLVEVMTLYCLLLQWHVQNGASIIEPIFDTTWVENARATWSQAICESDKFQYRNISSMSSNGQSSSSSEEASQNELLTSTVPENVKFEAKNSSSADEYGHFYISMELVRHTLWKVSVDALLNLIEFYMSQGGDLEVQAGDGTDVATGHLQMTYHVMQQFNHFSSYFLDKEKGGEEGCSDLEDQLSKLYKRHFRSVHIEAMKTTGTLLRHEPWQLVPLELTHGMNWRSGSSDLKCTDHSATLIMGEMYEAVTELLLASASNERNCDCEYIISRAQDHGFKYCNSFKQSLKDAMPPSHQHTHISRKKIQSCFGMSSKEFLSGIFHFVETNASGEQSFWLLTQSSANGLVKWVARLLAIGDVLPLVAGDAVAAVMALVDLYILTIFRFCAGNLANEDVLIGLGRGVSAGSASSTSVSLTMEADAVAPLPREEKNFELTQDFIKKSRARLENIVDLDRFQSSTDDPFPTSPRSKSLVRNLTKQLEKEVAAACSCFFAAIIVDVASNIFDGRHDDPPQVDGVSGMASSTEEAKGTRSPKKGSLGEYAKTVVSVVQNLVAQAGRFSATKAISGKELIFQIICCNRTWEHHSMVEQSNAYVDDLCERLSDIWGCMSSSVRLPIAVLQYTWKNLVWSAFMLLLEGFSKVSKCSAEGRTLMSMDLATLSHGLIPETVHAELGDDYPLISSPPHACREEMMRYVDKFIKVFYFPEEDMINWIKENSRDYHLDHSLSLVMSKAAGCKDKRFMTHGKKAVIDIYDHAIQ